MCVSNRLRGATQHGRNTRLWAGSLLRQILPPPCCRCCTPNHDAREYDEYDEYNGAREYHGARDNGNASALGDAVLRGWK